MEGVPGGLAQPTTVLRAYGVISGLRSALKQDAAFITSLPSDRRRLLEFLTHGSRGWAWAEEAPN
jgi:hypothetical protein